MATFTVTDCSTDSQLQDAISHATDGDTITFVYSGPISPRIWPLQHHLLIEGGNADRMIEGTCFILELSVLSVHGNLKKEKR